MDWEGGKTISPNGWHRLDVLAPSRAGTRSPEIAWTAIEGAAFEKHSIAVLNYANRETELVELEFRRKTLDSKARQEDATAQKLESEARLAETKEIQARLELFETLKSANAVPVWDASGKMAIVRAPADLNWDELRLALLSDAAKQIGSGQ